MTVLRDLYVVLLVAGLVISCGVIAVALREFIRIGGEIARAEKR